MPNETLIQELNRRYPLLNNLEFSVAGSDSAETAAPILALLMAMNDPAIEGDCCALLPDRTNIAAYTAILIALNSIAQNVDSAIARYSNSKFDVGERVCVMPSGHVYEFGGIFGQHQEFFKLNILKSSSGECRSFPIREIIRLEKTEKSSPRGTGRTDLSVSEPAPIDFLLDIRTFGNDALFENEVILVGAQNQFIDFMETLTISRRDQPEVKIQVRDLMPWGVVTPEGKIDFRDSAASMGAPVIAVASRAEYAAEACARGRLSAPRVIVDGVARVKNCLQAFDDLVDDSKLLLIASHEGIEHVREFEDRHCEVWSIPLDTPELLEGGGTALARCRDAYFNAANFEFEFQECESPLVDAIVDQLVLAEGAVQENEDMGRLLSFTYNLLIEIAAYMQFSKSCVADLEKKISSLVAEIEGKRIWLDESFTRSVLEACRLLTEFVTKGETPKSEVLLNLLMEPDFEPSDSLLSAESAGARESLAELATLAEKNVMTTDINGLSGLNNKSTLVITGWPKSRKFQKLLLGYPVRKVVALCYPFEIKWYKRATHRSRRLLARWQSTDDKLREMARVNAPLGNRAMESPLEDKNIPFDVLRFEQLALNARISGARGEAVTETRGARMVTFSDGSYAWLTESYKVPDITVIVEGNTDEVSSVKMKSVDQLQVNSFLLFRERSDRDIIRFVAERLIGENEYSSLKEMADAWRAALENLPWEGSSMYEVLRSHGFAKTEQTARNWRRHEDMIGPGDFSDLQTIARASGNTFLMENMKAVWGAIEYLRRAHLSAGMRLSQILVSQLPRDIEHSHEESAIELDLDGHSLGKALIVRVDGVAEDMRDIPVEMINHVISDF